MQVEIIQSGRVLRRIDHNGETFIEAPLRGTYSIRLTNNCPRQRMAVISVDGINVVDGKDAGFAGQGYLLSPWQTVDIKGWLRGPNEAAAFEFKASEASYAAGTGRGTKNTGVIGVAVFEGQEKRVEPPVKIIEQHHHHHHTYPVYKQWPTIPPQWWYGTPSDWTITTTTTSGALYGQASSAAYNAKTNPFPDLNVNCSATSNTPRSMDYSADSFNLNMVGDEDSFRGLPAAAAAAACGFDDDDDSHKMGKSTRKSKSFGGGEGVLRSRSLASTKDLGTGYGNRVAMYTQEATFTRASEVPAMVLTLRYAVREKLREWGVPVDTAIPAANPFPAASGYVAPPPGWRG